MTSRFCGLRGPASCQISRLLYKYIFKAKQPNFRTWSLFKHFFLRVDPWNFTTKVYFSPITYSRFGTYYHHEVFLKTTQIKSVRKTSHSFSMYGCQAKVSTCQDTRPCSVQVTRTAKLVIRVGHNLWRAESGSGEKICRECQMASKYLKACHTVKGWDLFGMA